MEVWDAYNKEFEKIEGMTLIRGEAIPDGVYHLVSDVIVRHADGTYLLMQRDSRKHFGGMWEATAGGSTLKGEGPLACAIRELREETGIESEELTEVGRVINDDNHTIYVEFLCVTDCEKECVSLQEGETSAFKWVTKDELISMKKDELVTERMQRFVDELKPSNIRLLPMTAEMYHCFFMEYENDPDLYLEGQEYVPYTFSEEKVQRYLQRQIDLKRIPLAIMSDEEIVGEIIIKNIEPHKCATLGITLKNAKYKDRGIGTQAEKLAVRYVFDELDIPTIFADTIKINTRSHHVLEKIGFTFIREDEEFKYYRIDRNSMDHCGWCNLSEEDKRFQVFESTLWSVFLSDEQDYIGRCILVLKRHCGSLSELTYDEWEELRMLICKVEACLKTVLGAALCNWSCLMNSFYKESEPNPHLHIHVRPRYDEPVMVNGHSYVDSEFGHHYALNKSGVLPAEDKEEVFVRLKEWLNR